MPHLGRFRFCSRGDLSCSFLMGGLPFAEHLVPFAKDSMWNPTSASSLCSPVYGGLASQCKGASPLPLKGQVHFQLSSTGLSGTLRSRQGPDSRAPPIPHPGTSNPHTRHPHSHDDPNIHHERTRGNCQKPTTLPSQATNTYEAPHRPQRCPTKWAE